MHKLKTIGLGLLFLGALIFVPNAKAQANSYKKTNLTSNTHGPAIVRGADLVNQWGIAPMGVVANTGSGFKVAGISSEFIFATEDGTISIGNARAASTTLALNNSEMGAVYKGLALVTERGGAQILLAANFHAGIVEAFDSNFAPVALRGAFNDPTLPAGFAPFGIHVVGDNEVIVTFAKQDVLKHDAVRTPGAGFVSLFDFQGNFVHRIASQGTLNAPWGAAMAPANFGHFAEALLIGNFGDGTISAFDLPSETFLGQLQDSYGRLIVNPSLRELVFDTAGQAGNSCTLFITASLGKAQHGVFAEITPDASTTPSFSLSASPSSLTVTRGSSGTVTITATANNGFNGTITGITCSGLPASTTYTFSKTSMMPVGMTTDSTTLTLRTSSPGGGGGGYIVRSMGLWLPLSTMGMLGLIVVDPRRRNKLKGRTWRRWLGYICGIVLMFSALFFSSGCGGGGSSSSGTPTVSGATVTVTAQSGMEMESTTFSLTVQ